MIQGNFYEKLHFYMDSCAISPTAFLFEVEKKVYNAKLQCLLEFVQLKVLRQFLAKFAQIWQI